MRRIAKVMPSALTFSQSIVPFHSLTSMPLAIAPLMMDPSLLTHPSFVQDHAGAVDVFTNLPLESKRHWTPSTVYDPPLYILPVSRSKK